MDLSGLEPNALALAAAVALDFAAGDPVYSWHPVRLMGRSLTCMESKLRSMRLDGYGGGVLLFLLLSTLWMFVFSVIVVGTTLSWQPLGMVMHILLVYSLLAMRDLLQHAWRVDAKANEGDLSGARQAVSQLVGRDTDKMDFAACRRAAIESMSENFTDGFLSPIFWYLVAGIPGIVLFKVVSTMDSMVGFKIPRYLQFGWCGAKLDDLMNLLPARVSWIVIALIALIVPGCSMRKAWITGWQQHAIIPGPNSGWSEAAIAGAIQRRLIGPVWFDGHMVTDVWIGYPGDPEARTSEDLQRASVAVVLSALFITMLSLVWLQTGPGLRAGLHL